ncbi:hypothetical protein PA598K_05433 [Paenibacillus sp. 598K]|uniref:helix-turn-helix domain-containing protein n=1 Tax=Paenibacillus sp. 598K TaxID=1117987 RepID=UPI000FF9F847|nr:helix-turn-helix domain-containing protein [Paenibacillus sp. 598K]GBF76919.1 hypothetical protein PA598K_05433 [Paenibacillus sp. 598K]
MDKTLQQHEHLQLWMHAHIRITHMGKMSVPPGAQGVGVAFPTSGFFCISGGSALMLLNNRIYSPHHMHIFHVPRGSWVELNAGVDGLEYSTVLYEAELAKHTPSAVKDKLKTCNPFVAAYHFAPPHPGMLYALLTQMYELWLEQQPSAGLRLKGLAYQWISHVVEQYHTWQDPMQPISPAQQVTMAMEYMLEHYANSLTLESLAAAMQLSPGHLSNRFKQILNRGPIDCLIRLRMEKARKLLEETMLPLRSIASSVGYQDVYYFSKAFKKQFGCSPSAYRRQRVRNNQHEQENVTSEEGRLHIDTLQQRSYTDNNYYYQLADGGSNEMFKHNKMVPASLLLAFGLLIGACGNSGTESPAVNSGNAAPIQTEAAASPGKESGTEKNTQAATRIVSTAKGDVEVPANPERVVTDFYLGYLLALDVKPLGSNKVFMENPYLEGMVDGIVDVSDNLEVILSLDPDLIVTGSADKYEAFSQIAPTVFIENIADVREQTLQLGTILGKEETAEAWLADFEKQLAEAKARVHKIIQEDEIVTVFDGGIMKDNTIYGNAYTGRAFHGELGLNMHENVVRDINPEIGWLRISNELVTEYAGDYIFMAVDTKNESFDYAADPFWSAIEAVRKNRIYEIDGYRFYFSDPISVMGQVRDVANMLESRLAE